MNYSDLYKTTEIQVDSLRIRRRVRLAQFIVGKDADGNEVEFEVSDGAAEAVLEAIREASSAKG
jgi:hypothetical protein